MTILRQAAQQALEAMDKATRFMSDSDYKKLNEAIDALKAALAEQPVPPPEAMTIAEKTAYAAGWWKALEVNRREVYERGFVDGMSEQAKRSVDKAVNALAESEQEPVAWRQPNWSRRDGAYLYYDADDKPLTNAQPLYTTPPQRKPLSDEEIFACENSVTDEVISDRAWCIHFARAIEAAHGIGGQE